MKIFPNLAGGLRTFFGVVQVFLILSAVLWTLMITVGPMSQRRKTEHSKLMVSFGEVVLEAAPNAVALSSPDAAPGSLQVHQLRGTLNMDLLSKDPALLSAVRRTTLPSIGVLIVFSVLLCDSLRKLCANISRGIVLSDKNLALVRRVGALMIGYSLAAAVMAVWCSHTMGGFLHDVTVTGIEAASEYPNGLGAVRFSLSSALTGNTESLITGCLVLVLAEAFRQGLALKTESDLTV